jgi:hypothetical protein
MIVDIPQVKAEVEAAFAAYERALVDNDVEALDNFFRRARGRSASEQVKTSLATRRSGRSEPAARRRVWREI